MADAVALGSEDAAPAKAVADAWAKAELTPGLPAACMPDYPLIPVILGIYTVMQIKVYYQAAACVFASIPS